MKSTSSDLFVLQTDPSAGISCSVSRLAFGFLIVCHQSSLRNLEVFLFWHSAQCPAVVLAAHDCQRGRPDRVSPVDAISVEDGSLVTFFDAVARGIRCIVDRGLLFRELVCVVMFEFLERPGDLERWPRHRLLQRSRCSILVRVRYRRECGSSSSSGHLLALLALVSGSSFAFQKLLGLLLHCFL